VLEADHVHIWLTDPQDCHDPSLTAIYLTWLDEQEHDRYARFKFEPHRHTFLVAHALLRSCLAQYGNTQPGSLSFTRTPQGRPELVPIPELPPLRFSLSHTTGLAACAIVQNHTIGLDAEYTQRKVDIRAVAKASFTQQEQQELQHQTIQAQREYFFNHWTLKEAYAKALGLGLYLPFKEFGFHLQAQLEPSIQLKPTNPQAEWQNWQFAVFDPTPSHRMALAVQSSQALQATIQQCIPGLNAHQLWPPLTYSRGIVLASTAPRPLNDLP